MIPRRLAAIAALACSALVLCVPRTSRGAFHLWQLKEFYSTSDGSVQFIELFTSFSGQNFLSGHTLTATSDGVTNTFTFPSNLANGAANTHLLLATANFGSLAGGVTPDYAATPLPANFFNPNATNISFNFAGFDVVATTGAAFPKDGLNSFTDTTLGAAPTLVAGVNSPTNSAGATGSINLAPSFQEADFTEDGNVDAADLSRWSTNYGTPSGGAHTQGDANADGAVNGADYLVWQQQFAIPAAMAAINSVPEPSACLLMLLAGAGFVLRARR